MIESGLAGQTCQDCCPKDSLDCSYLVYYSNSCEIDNGKSPIKSKLRLVAPTTENRTVTPTRQPNTAYRTREYLTDAEVDKLIGAARCNRYGHRDATILNVAYRHGLRASELAVGSDRLQRRHPHMLRHACGFALANKGHDTRALQAYLGHRNIQHTVRYTELSPDRFKDFWR
jgi:site-specific recombinase XerD